MQEDIVIIATPFHPVKWGSFIARGLLALIIGILVLIWTGIAVQVVVTLIGILIILAAILALVLALKPPAGASRSVVLLVMGVLGLLVGIAAILYRWIAAEALTVIIALLMLFFGFIDLSIAIFQPGVYTAPVPACFFRGNLDNSRRGIFLPAGIRCDSTRCRISRDICHHLRYPEYSHRCHGKKRTEEGDVRVTGFIVRIPADFSGRSGHQSSTGRCVRVKSIFSPRSHP